MAIRSPLGTATPRWKSRARPLGDSEPDGLPDVWEFQYFGNLGQTAADNPDADAFNNLAEYQAGSNPTNASLFRGTSMVMRCPTPGNCNISVR